MNFLLKTLKIIQNNSKKTELFAIQRKLHHKNRSILSTPAAPRISKTDNPNRIQYSVRWRFFDLFGVKIGVNLIFLQGFYTNRFSHFFNSLFLVIMRVNTICHLNITMSHDIL